MPNEELWAPGLLHLFYLNLCALGFGVSVCGYRGAYFSRRRIQATSGVVCFEGPQALRYEVYDRIAVTHSRMYAIAVP